MIELDCDFFSISVLVGGTRGLIVDSELGFAGTSFFLSHAQQSNGSVGFAFFDL